MNDESDFFNSVVSTLPELPDNALNSFGESDKSAVAFAPSLTSYAPDFTCGTNVSLSMLLPPLAVASVQPSLARVTITTPTCTCAARG